MNLKYKRSHFLFLAVLIIFSSCKQNQFVTTTFLSETRISDTTSSGIIIKTEMLEVGSKLKTYGHCYSTHANPTISDAKTVNSVDKAVVGTFADSITGLLSNTNYYIRAYVEEDEINYSSDEKSFITKKFLLITTNAVTNINKTTATCGGNVTTEGDEKISGEVKSVTARGVCYSTSQNPDISNDHTTDGSGTGTFISNLTGLTYNTTYYVRAYATNSVGTSYGEQKTFTTLEFDLVEMVLVQGGSFEMGCGTGQSGCGSDEMMIFI